MTLDCRNNLNWSKLNVDGLYPGMSLAEAIAKNWCQDSGILVPNANNPLKKSGHMHSARWENDTIVLVVGGTLFEDQRPILVSGEDLMTALTKLPFNNSMIKHEALDRTIMIVENGPKVQHIFFSKSSWESENK